MATPLFFWICAFLAFFFGLGVIVARNPMHSALSLVMTFLATAGLFLLLHAEFLAWILIIVYSGAVMVLMIFVISLLNLQSEEPIQFTAARRWGIALVVVFISAFLIFLFRDSSVGFAHPLKMSIPLEWGSAQAIAADLFTRYLFPFELASVLLTAAVIGSVVIARKPERDETDPAQKDSAEKDLAEKNPAILNQKETPQS